MISEFIRQLIRAILQLIFPSKLKMSNALHVYIKSNTGNTLSVELDPKWDIRTLKERIAPKLGLTPEDVKIIFAGKELMDSIVIEVWYVLKYFFLDDFLDLSFILQHITLS